MNTFIPKRYNKRCTIKKNICTVESELSHTDILHNLGEYIYEAIIQRAEKFVTYIFLCFS